MFIAANAVDVQLKPLEFCHTRPGTSIYSIFRSGNIGLNFSLRTIYCACQKLAFDITFNLEIKEELEFAYRTSFTFELFV